MKLKFLGKEHLCSDIWELHFKKPLDFKFRAGQYLQLRLNLKHPDNRGSKRWFTISSAPTQEDITITTRLIEKHSEFKDDFFHLKPGNAITATGPHGDFLLPVDVNTSILWIAGGIGATPFISQMKFLLDNGILSRDIVFIHGLRDLLENPADKVIRQCQKKMAKFSYFTVISELSSLPKNYSGYKGYIDSKVIESIAPDFKKRQIYVSGPEPMVDSIKKILIKNLAVREKNIHQDWFPGYKDKY